MTIYFKDGRKTEAKTLDFYENYIRYTKPGESEFPKILHACPINTVKTIHIGGFLMEVYPL